MKRVLFFFVHPSKYYLFRFLINNLKKEGVKVDIVIVNKDILEELIKNEGWEYHNLIPSGRRIKNVPPLLATSYFFFITLWKLFVVTKGVKYDLFIGDDVLPIVGRFKGVCSLHFQDDDINYVPESKLILKFCTKVFAPKVTNLGVYDRKKISYNGYHELAYLHPKYFKPDKKKVETLIKEGKPYFILRLVSLTASHDRGKKGIDNDFVKKIIKKLSEYGNVFITSERPLIDDFEEFRINLPPQSMPHVLAFSKIFIGDSQTMSTEAALLGVPSIRYNSFVGLISTMNEIEEKYDLSFGFKPGEEKQLFEKLDYLLNCENLSHLWKVKLDSLLQEKDDLNIVMRDNVFSFLS